MKFDGLLFMAHTECAHIEIMASILIDEKNKRKRHKLHTTQSVAVLNVGATGWNGVLLHPRFCLCTPSFSRHAKNCHYYVTFRLIILCCRE